MNATQWAREAYTQHAAALPPGLAPEQIADLLTDPVGDPNWDHIPAAARIDAWRHLYHLAIRATGAPVNTRRRRRRWRKWMDPDLKPTKTARRKR